MKAMTGAENLTGLKMDRDVMRISTAMVDGLTALNSELITYAQNSWRSSLTLADEMRNCQSARDILDLQLRHARQSYEDYLAEARKVGDMVARISNETVAALSPAPR